MANNYEPTSATFHQQLKVHAYETYGGLVCAKCPEDIDQAEEKAKALRVVNKFNKDFLKKKIDDVLTTYENLEEGLEAYQFDLQDALVEANLLEAAKFVHLLYKNKRYGLVDDPATTKLPEVVSIQRQASQSRHDGGKIGVDEVEDRRYSASEYRRLTNAAERNLHEIRRLTAADTKLPLARPTGHQSAHVAADTIGSNRDAAIDLTKSPPRKRVKLEGDEPQAQDDEDRSRVGDDYDAASKATDDAEDELSFRWSQGSPESSISGLSRETGNQSLVNTPLGVDREQLRSRDTGLLEEDVRFVFNCSLATVLRWIEHDGGLDQYDSWKNLKKLREGVKQRAATFLRKALVHLLSFSKKQWADELKLKDELLKIHIQALYAIQFCRKAKKSRSASRDSVKRVMDFISRFQRDLATYNQSYNTRLSSLGADVKIGNSNETLLQTAIHLKDSSLVKCLLNLGAKDSVGSALALATTSVEGRTSDRIVDLRQKHTIVDLPHLKDPDWLIPPEKKVYLCRYFTKDHRCGHGRGCEWIHRHGPWKDLVDHIWNEMDVHTFPLDWSTFKERTQVRELRAGDQVWFTAGYAHYRATGRSKYKILSAFYAEGGDCITSSQGVAWYRSTQDALAALERVVTISLWAVAREKSPSDYAASLRKTKSA